jgi:hypothetical protein
LKGDALKACKDKAEEKAKKAGEKKKPAKSG